MWAIGGAGVAIAAWSWLYVLTIVSTAMLWRSRWAGSKQPRWWLIVAGYCLLAALFFYGADKGLDALNGAARKKADVAASLGGIELWFVLLPGLFSIAVGSSIRAAMQRTGAHQV